MPVVGQYVGFIAPEDVNKLRDIQDEWVRGLKGARDRIKAHLVAKIPDETNFLTKVVNVAVPQYESYINPDHPKALTAKIKFKAKLSRAYPKWNTGVNNAFAEGGAFETNVENKKDKILEVKYTLGAVGQKAVLGYNALPKAVMLLVGDTRLPSYIEGAKGDSLTGSPFNIFKAEVRNYVRPLFIAKGVMTTVYAYYFNEAGDTSSRNTILTDFNTFASQVITAFKDTGKSGSLTMEWDATANKIKITAVAESS